MEVKILTYYILIYEQIKIHETILTYVAS